MMRRISMLFGAIVLVAGLTGLFMVKGGMVMGDVANPPLLISMFPVNLAHNLSRLLIGVWGLVAARSFGAARRYCRSVGIIYVALAALGLVAPIAFGLIPIGGANVWLHAGFGVVLSGIGFIQGRGATNKG